MFRPTAIFIGSRYTRARRGNQFVSFISLLSLLGLTLGVAVLITVISVMNGFEAEIRNRTLSAVPHLQISSTKGIDDYQALSAELLQQEGVISAAPFVGGKGMLSVPGLVRGVRINGIVPEQESQVSTLDTKMLSGELSDLEAGQYGVVIGVVTAQHLGLHPGDKLSLTLPALVVTPMGVFPRVKRFTVVGVFELGAELDSSTVFIHMTDAAKLFRSKGEALGVRLKLNDLFKAPELRQQLEAGYEDEFQWLDWSQTQGGVFQAIQMEKRVMGLLLMIVVIVAVFNIISIVVMMVSDKRAAIAVLRTMGMSAAAVVSIFITQGTLIGFVGVVSGTLLGLGVALNISTIVASMEQMLGLQVFDPSVFQIVHMPSLVQTKDVLLISGASFALSVLATLYPAWKAATVEAAEVLKYE